MSDLDGVRILTADAHSESRTRLAGENELAATVLIHACRAAGLQLAIGSPRHPEDGALAMAESARKPYVATIATGRAKHTVHVPMRDGRTLAADVYREASGRGRRPAILIQTPYGKGQFRGALGEGTRSHGLFDASREVFVVVDVRGFGESANAGPFPDPQARGRDGYDLVEWIAAQPWCNGRVGTWGPSALGRVQYTTAHERPPHLVCCVPLVAGMGPLDYREFFDHGVLRKSHVDTIAVLGFELDPRIVTAESPEDEVFHTDAPFGPIERLDVPILMITGWYDTSVEKHLESFAALRRLAGPVARASSRLLVGPWEHMSVGLTRQGQWTFPAAAGESDRAARAFFDYWLHDRRDHGWADAPIVRWMPVGGTRWHESRDLCEIAVQTRTWFLTPGGGLAPAPAAVDSYVWVPFDPADPVPTLGGANLSRVTGSDVDAGPFDQRPIESREDVVVFDAPAQQTPLMIFGSITFRPTFCVEVGPVASTAAPERDDERRRSEAAGSAAANAETPPAAPRPATPGCSDATLAIRVCDVHPDGRSMLLVDGIISARFARSTQPRQPCDAGVIHGALRLAPMAAKIDAAHVLRISISCTNYPRFALPASSAETEVRLRLGGRSGSRLDIPCIPEAHGQ